MKLKFLSGCVSNAVVVGKARHITAGVLFGGALLVGMISPAPLLAESVEANDPPPPPQNLIGTILTSIQESEYEIRWQDSVGAYQSPNRANNLRFTYLADGFVVTRRAPVEETDIWSAGIFLTGKGGRGNFVPEPGSAFACATNKAVIAHHEVAIHYINTREGMRQTFIVGSNPNPGEGLVLFLGVELQGLSMSLDGEANSIWFSNMETGKREFRYFDLKVWDATGRVLPSKFQQITPTEFAIGVDALNAVYPITVDPLSQSPLFNETDPQSGCQFGFSIAQYRRGQTGCNAHLVIGAPYYDNGQTDEGRIFIYEDNCGALFSTSPDWTAESNDADAHLGWSVAMLDADSDGNPDVATGAPGYSNDGAVFIWHGSGSGYGTSGTPANADWSAFGQTSAQSQFGYSIAGINDLIGSGGHDSLAVGAPYFNSGTNYYTGKVYAFYGGQFGIGSTADWTAQGTGLYEHLGWSVAAGGDVNSDSNQELLVGSPAASGWGYINVWYGASTTLAANPDRKFSDAQSGSRFGWSVASAGDVDGDGYGDVIIGAPYHSDGQSGEGKALLYKGSSIGLSTSAAWTAQSDQSGAHLGFSVSSTGDYDFDGYDGVIVGAPHFDITANANEGRVFVWDGASGGLGSDGNPNNYDWDISNIGAGNLTGYVVGAFEQRYQRGVFVGAPGDDNVTLWNYVP